MDTQTIPRHDLLMNIQRATAHALALERALDDARDAAVTAAERVIAAERERDRAVAHLEHLLDMAHQGVAA